VTSSMERLVSPVRSTPRLMPAPSSEPPYDDELGVSPAPARQSPGATQGTLALTFTLPSGVAATPQPPRLRLVEGTGSGPADAADAPAALAEVQAWAGTLAQAVVEVLAGDRPVGQLLRWTTARIYADVSRRAGLAARECTAVRRGRSRAVVRRVRVCQPAAGVAEATAVVSDGHRTRAIALRLQRTDGRWLCTALQLG
jgi:Family of unknown function (DUF6459)